MSNPEKATEYLTRVNWKSLVEWMTAEAILNRPADPLQFARDLIGARLGERGGSDFRPEQVLPPACPLPACLLPACLPPASCRLPAYLPACLSACLPVLLYCMSAVLCVLCCAVCCAVLSAVRPKSTAAVM
jgi:hypothetical protein